MWRVSSLRFAVTAALMLAGCIADPSSRRCNSDSDCVRAGQAGACVSVGDPGNPRWCAYYDPSCSGGLRFGELATEELRNQCAPNRFGGPDGGFPTGWDAGLPTPDGAWGDAAAADDAGACTALQTSPPDVVASIEAGSPPTPTGGSIFPGTYVLVQVQRYGSTQENPLSRSTLRFEGTTWQQISRPAGSTLDSGAAGELSMTGPFLFFRPLCGNASSAFGYSTDGLGRLVLRGSSSELVYTYKLTF